MRLRIAGLLLAAMAAPIAAAECDAGTPDLLVASEWTAVPHQMMGNPASKAAMTFTNQGAQPIRMIDAAFTISTVLGRMIGYPMKGPSAVKIAPGETFTFEVALPGTELLDSHPDDIVVTICTRQVVYDDGTVGNFE